MNTTDQADLTVVGVAMEDGHRVAARVPRSATAATLVGLRAGVTYMVSVGAGDAVPFRTEAARATPRADGGDATLNTTFTAMFRIAEFSTTIDFLANHDR